MIGLLFLLTDVLFVAILMLIQNQERRIKALERQEVFK